MATEQMVQVESKCKKCKKVSNFEIPKAGLAARHKGTPLILAFPTVDRAILAQLVTHVCPSCQEKLAGEAPSAV